MFPYPAIGFNLVSNLTNNGLPLIQPLNVNDFFDSLYAVMYPVMPFLMIALATSAAGYFIYVVRSSFSFGSFQKDDYKYNEKDDE